MSHVSEKLKPEKLTRPELILEVTNAMGEDHNEVTRERVEQTLAALAEVVYANLSVGVSVPIKGLVIFSRFWREEHQARNPATGGKVTIPSKWRVRFRESRTLQAEVNRGSDVWGK